MAITLEACLLILKEHHLLKSSAIQDNLSHQMTAISYDSRKVGTKGLFFCKGQHFRPTYLNGAREQGAIAYVSEQPYVEGKGMHALIVRNSRKAMALLAAAFYDYPQDELYIIAFTGTKGKTTSAYFTRGALSQATQQRTALFSTVDRILGPRPDQRFKSDLTTPESLDLFRDMRRAVDNGMTHLVMEVSSQAYKTNRVFGLTFDVGVFLNISPDHIGKNEHPTFADYLHCKLQLLVNARRCLINAETDHFDEVYAAATTTTDPDSIYLFGSEDFQQHHPEYPLDFTFTSLEADLAKSRFALAAKSLKARPFAIDGQYDLQLIGDYNESNACAALIAASFAGAKAQQAAADIAQVKIPGRMERLDIPEHGRVYVDYAHNYLSMVTFLGFLKQEYPQAKLHVVVGSPGDKGISRREGFAKALNQFADTAILTSDDPGFEDPAAIAAQIMADIDQQKVSAQVILDRAAAIKTAILNSQAGDLVVLAGKGADATQKVRGVDTPWPTDMAIAQQVAQELN